MNKEMTDWERVVADLQLEIIQQEEAIYSARVLEEARDPKNLGRMAEADAQAIVKGSCGDTIEIYLRLEGPRIQEATFMTDGCGPSLACGSCLTTMVQGMSLEEAGAIQAEDLVAVLDGLPESHAHCADLAVMTLREAVRDREAGVEAPQLPAPAEGGGR